MKSVAVLALASLASVSAAPDFFCYEDDLPCGPSSWGTLEIDNNQCDGLKNSPIAIDDDGCTAFMDYTFTPGTCGAASNLKFTIDDHVVKAAYPDSGCDLNQMMIPVVGGPYAALQLHLHMFSEHTIDGKHFGAELHIVHAEVNGPRFAVAGMMISGTALMPHPVFEELLVGWEGVAAETAAKCGRRALGEEEPEPVTRKLPKTNFNAYDLLPADTGFFHYDGGLTTPPCSEVVWWNLANTPLEVSVAQYTRVSNLILGFVDPETCAKSTVASPGGSTSRPPQPLNGRVVDLICPTSLAPPPGEDPEDDAPCMVDAPGKGKKSKKGKRGKGKGKRGKGKGKKDKGKKGKGKRALSSTGVRGAN